jgi:hypothetical protein
MSDCGTKEEERMLEINGLANNVVNWLATSTDNAETSSNNICVLTWIQTWKAPIPYPTVTKLLLT